MAIVDSVEPANTHKGAFISAIGRLLATIAIRIISENNADK